MRVDTLAKTQEPLEIKILFPINMGQKLRLRLKCSVDA